jgi:RHS repeat-associated protein
LTAHAPISENAHRGYQLLPALVPRTRTPLTTRRHWRNRVSVRRRASGRVHYNYFRDYDPAVGRYVESDPIGLEGGIGTYSYVDNSPAELSDPTGLVPGPRPSTPEQTEAARRFNSCVEKCALSAVGLGALAGAGMVAAGQPIPGSKNFITPNSSKGTSFISRWARSQGWGNARLPGGARWWTPTAARPFAMGSTWGKVVGRWVPWVGWGMLATDLVLIGNCIDDCLDGSCHNE